MLLRCIILAAATLLCGASAQGQIWGAVTDSVGFADGFLYCRFRQDEYRSYACYGDDLGDFPVKENFELTLAYPLPSVLKPLDSAILLERVTPAGGRNPRYLVHATRQLYVDASPGAFAPAAFTPAGVGNATLSGGQTTQGFYLHMLLDRYQPAPGSGGGSGSGKLGSGWAWVPVAGYEGLFQLYWNQTRFEERAQPTYGPLRRGILVEGARQPLAAEGGGLRQAERRVRRSSSSNSRLFAQGPNRIAEQQTRGAGGKGRRATADGPSTPPEDVGLFWGLPSDSTFEWVQD